MKKTVLLMIIAGMTCLFFCGCSSSGNTAAQRLIDNWPAGVVEAVNAVSDRCIESSDGNGSAVYFWKTDEYLLSPAPEKLLKTDFNRINSIANYEYQAALEKLLKQSSFRLCSPEETSELIKLFYDKITFSPEIRLWELDRNLYLCIVHCGGNSGERSYDFFTVNDGKAYFAGTYSYPPDKFQIREVAGFLSLERK